MFRRKEWPWLRLDWEMRKEGSRPWKRIDVKTFLGNGINWKENVFRPLSIKDKIKSFMEHQMYERKGWGID